VTLHFTGSRLQVVSSDQSWHELLDSNFEKVPHERAPLFSTDHQPPIHLQEGGKLRRANTSDFPVLKPTAPATEVSEGGELEDEEPSPRTTN
jgi:hypothetical protein